MAGVHFVCIQLVMAERMFNLLVCILVTHTVEHGGNWVGTLGHKLHVTSVSNMASGFSL